MPANWMIRAGKSGFLIEDFARCFVAVGFKKLEDLSGVRDREAMRAAYIEAYPDNKPGRQGNAVAMIHKFCNVVEPGDGVATYDPKEREYLIGVIKSGYSYKFGDGAIGDYRHVREVEWTRRTLQAYDKHNLFTNRFLDVLLPG